MWYPVSISVKQYPSMCGVKLVYQWYQLSVKQHQWYQARCFRCIYQWYVHVAVYEWCQFCIKLDTSVYRCQVGVISVNHVLSCSPTPLYYRQGVSVSRVSPVSIPC